METAKQTVERSGKLHVGGTGNGNQSVLTLAQAMPAESSLKQKPSDASLAFHVPLTVACAST